MAETRAGKYGKFLGAWVEHTIDSQPEELRKQYTDQFLAELATYSLVSRRNGEPVNEGCVHELRDVSKIDFDNPIHLALLVKEGIHLMYQKGTAGRVLEALNEKLDQAPIGEDS
jgi:hypothetical protein